MGMHSAVLASVVVLVGLHAVAHTNAIELPFWVVTMAMSLLLIYGGSVYSLVYTRFVDDTEPEAAMSSSDAMKTPLIAGAVLVGLYLCFKWFDPSYVNIILRLYFFVIGVFAVADFVAFVLEAFARTLGSKGVTKRIAVLPFGMGSVSAYHVLGFLVGVAVAGGEAYAKQQGWAIHWLLNNAVGTAICFEALGKLSVGSPKTGMMLLALLFVYDIAMVFGTKSVVGEGIMQSVAGKVDGPILLMFPHFNSSLAAGELPKFSKLGLGDICFPGAFIALLLRYDAFRAGKWLPASDPGTATQTAELERIAKDDNDAVFPSGYPGGPAVDDRFPSPYFFASTVLYILGLGVTLVVMLVFEHPQPALLYLSPACCIAAMATAIALGDWNGVWEYTEEFPEDGVRGKPRDDAGGTVDAAGDSEATHDVDEKDEDDSHSDSGDQPSTRVRQRRARREM